MISRSCVLHYKAQNPYPYPLQHCCQKITRIEQSCFSHTLLIVTTSNYTTTNTSLLIFVICCCYCQRYTRIKHLALNCLVNISTHHQPQPMLNASSILPVSAHTCPPVYKPQTLVLPASAHLQQWHLLSACPQEHESECTWAECLNFRHHPQPLQWCLSLAVSHHSSQPQTQALPVLLAHVCTFA